jgi:hypothetical protein
LCRRCRLPSVLGGPAATQVAAAQNLVALKVEEGKARAEAEALKLGREVAALPEKAALRARDEITALPGKAAQGAKEALFGQQKAARDKVRLAHKKKRAVKRVVDANNAHLAEVARVVVPGLKPTPPPPPPPKKLFGMELPKF